MYYWKQGVNVYINTNQLDSVEESAVVFKTDAYCLDILTIYPAGDKNTYTWYKVVASTGVASNVGLKAYNRILSEANVAQTTGTSPTDVMNQKAVTDMVFHNGNKYLIQIGSDASSTGETYFQSIAIGRSAKATFQDSLAIGAINAAALAKYAIAVGSYASTDVQYGTAIGSYSNVRYKGSVGLGAYSQPKSAGSVEIGSTSTAYGYNNSHYRLLTGLYDGQSAHDAATVAQGNRLMTAAPTTTDEGVLGQLWTDTTNMHTYQCTAIDTTDPDNPVYTWTQRW